MNKWTVAREIAGGEMMVITTQFEKLIAERDEARRQADTLAEALLKIDSEVGHIVIDWNRVQSWARKALAEYDKERSSR